MLLLASVLDEQPDVFIEYRLRQLRRRLDPAVDFQAAAELLAELEADSHGCGMPPGLAIARAKSTT
jgi:hypothetical protein